MTNQNGSVTSLLLCAGDMRSFRNPLPVSVDRGDKHGPAFIAVGICILLANAAWPAVPVATGMGLTGLGVILTVVARWRSCPERRHLIATNIFVYSTLYLLFVGAVLHTAVGKTDARFELLQGIDLLLSVIPMVAAVRIAFAAIAGDEDVPAR